MKNAQALAQPDGRLALKPAKVDHVLGAGAYTALVEEHQPPVP